MPKLPQISGQELTKVFKKEDWLEKSQRGSHLKLIKQTSGGKLTIIIPMHKILKKGTLARILKDANLSVEKLKEVL